jgi:hypothetical protein
VSIPPSKKHRVTDEEDQPLGNLNAVSIDRKILLMLVQTVNELKEGVKKGQETRTNSSVFTKSASHSEDEDMAEDEDLS